MRLSVITVNLNNASGLKKTIGSVLKQTSWDFEHIIIDGGSTDDSVAVIKSFTPIPPGIFVDQEQAKVKDENITSPQNSIFVRPQSLPAAKSPGRKVAESQCHPIVYWISEPDSGIYVAMNKGIKRAAGEYLLFLNSGDVLYGNDVLSEVFACDLKADVVLGKVNICRQDTSVVKDYMIPHKDLSLFSLYLYGIPHQACFIKKTLFDECGLYDEALKINADWKFFVEALVIKSKTLQHIPVTITDFDGSGISSSNKNLLLKERQKIFDSLVPERIRMDYNRIFPHYYEVYRIQWLLKHPFFYRVYRAWVSLGMRITNSS